MKVGVLGAGTMGNGIAHASALSGFKPLLMDLNEDVLHKGLKVINKGHIFLEFLPQIEVGLDKKEVLEKVEYSIESATNKLLS